jgi:hypothetical protein
MRRCSHPVFVRPPEQTPLLFADSALELSALFLSDLAAHKSAAQTRAETDERAPRYAWAAAGVPRTFHHYEYPRGVDTAMSAYHELRRRNDAGGRTA